jgi:predicted MFS family arabinose efflux permease
MPELAFWLGMMVGNTFFGWTADIYGGRRTIVFVSAVISIMSLFIGFTSDLGSYTFCSLVIGFCALSASNISQERERQCCQVSL